MKEKEERRFAVLIDADNVSAKYIKYILDEVSNYGIVTYKRIYGDWTKDNTGSWKKVLLENSITPIQQYNYTIGKNSTDSAMIIDAMDILYSGSVEGFCLVSSDSDFTRLAARIRESGMMVIGMGEKKTPRPFSAACNVFKYLDILVDEIMKEEAEHDKIGGDLETDSVEAGMTDIKTIEDTLIKIIADNGNEEGCMDIAALANYLGKRYPDFDVRNYGYTKFSMFLSEFDSLTKERGKDTILVGIKESEMKNRIEKKLVEIVQNYKNRGIYMKKLYESLLEFYPDFNPREYGYTSFSQFIRSLDSLRIKNIPKGGSVKTVVMLGNIV